MRRNFCSSPDRLLGRSASQSTISSRCLPLSMVSAILMMSVMVEVIL